jgi:hypothetical protein
MQGRAKLIEIANAAVAVQDGRIHIELINEPFLVTDRRLNSGPASNAR